MHYLYDQRMKNLIFILLFCVLTEELFSQLVKLLIVYYFIFSLTSTPGSRLRPKTLQVVDVPILDSRLCEDWHRQKGINVIIYDEMMCAGSVLFISFRLRD